MKLLLQNRLVLLGILPEKGNFLTLKIVRKLREDLSLSEEEMKEMEVTQTATGVKWEMDKDKGKEISIGEIATEMIKKKLRDMDKKEELTANHLPLYEIFVGE